MSERGTHLLEKADRQINELLALFSRRSEATLRLPCPGREKLGDGTVAALALHTADNYLRIAGFLQGTSQISAVRPGRHRIPRLFRAGAHTPPRHAGGGRDESTHDGHYRAENIDLRALMDRLSAGQDKLSLLADMTDEQFDAAPPTGSFRFCDGQRTLEQVVASLLNHQGHQIDAIKAAVN